MTGRVFPSEGVALPAGWTLYRDLDAGKPDADRDFGARRGDGRARCFGVRDPDGSPRHVRATVPRRAACEPFEWEGVFPPGELRAACESCDLIIVYQDERHFPTAAQACIRAFHTTAEELEAFAESEASWHARGWGPVAPVRVRELLGMSLVNLGRAPNHVPNAEHRAKLKDRLQQVREGFARCVEPLEKAIVHASKNDVTGEWMARELRQVRAAFETARDGVRLAAAIQREEDWRRWWELVRALPSVSNVKDVDAVAAMLAGFPSVDGVTVDRCRAAALTQEDLQRYLSASFVLHVAWRTHPVFPEKDARGVWDTAHRAAFEAWKAAPWFVTPELP